MPWLCAVAINISQGADSENNQPRPIAIGSCHKAEGMRLRVPGQERWQAEGQVTEHVIRRHQPGPLMG